MRIADVMTTSLPAVGPTDVLRDAARRMNERGVQALPVCDGKRLVGIVTDWDVTRAVAIHEDAPDRPVRDYMSTDLVSAEPDCTFAEATEMLAERGLHHLLVRDGDEFRGMVHLDVEWSELGGIEAPMATFAARI